jgi:hypothetical protein
MTNEIKTSLEILESLLGVELIECTKIAGFQHLKYRCIVINEMWLECNPDRSNSGFFEYLCDKGVPIEIETRLDIPNKEYIGSMHLGTRKEKHVYTTGTDYKMGGWVPKKPMPYDVFILDPAYTWCYGLNPAARQIHLIWFK